MCFLFDVGGINTIKIFTKGIHEIVGQLSDQIRSLEEKQDKLRAENEILMRKVKLKLKIHIYIYYC